MCSGHWREFRGPALIIAVKWCILCGCCVKHNQHVKHANVRGLGACPRKNLKMDVLRLNLRSQ